MLQQKRGVKYFLEESARGVYFTVGEARLMARFLEGQSVQETAEHYGLSEETVNFYLKNMTKKCQCETQEALIQQVKKTEFLKTYLKNTVDT